MVDIQGRNGCAMLPDANVTYFTFYDVFGGTHRKALIPFSILRCACRARPSANLET